jgi:sugar phosphate isomerase/epimerase
MKIIIITFTRKNKIMNRRNFIQKGMATLAVCQISGMAVMPAIASNVGAKSKKRNRLGIQLYSIHKELPKDFTGCLKKLSDIGYTYAEAYGWNGKTFLDKSLKETASIFAGEGMQLIGTHCGTDILPADVETKEWDYWRNSAYLMKEAGGKHLVQSWLPPHPSIDALKRIAEQFNKVGRLCKKESIKFGYHNHYAELQKVEGSVILDILLENTDPSLVFFQMDMGHTVNGGGDILSYMHKYPGRFLSWHASDFKIGKGYTEVGKGDTPYDALFKIAHSYGVESVIVEQETEGDIFQSCKNDFDYMARFSWIKGD